MGGTSDQGHILVKGTKTGLPYSKGLLASSVQATGLDPGMAYHVAETVEGALVDADTELVTVEQLRDVTTRVLEEEVGEDAAERYRRWQLAQERDLPLLLLIGGPTGGGKSTVATQVAQRLGVTRIVSTDAVREIMRATIGAELLPALHVSSFEAGGATEVDGPGEERDALVAGFVRQVRAVSVGVQHVLERAVEERADTLVEGVHLVPDLIELPAPSEAITVQVVLTIDDEHRHRSHLSGRSQEQPHRPPRRYLDHFREIRLLQEEVIARARDAGVATVSSFALDQTVEEVTSLVVDAVTQRRFEEAGGGQRSA